MDVFALRERLIGDYSKFARSFTTIQADDLRQGGVTQTNRPPGFPGWFRAIGLPSAVLVGSRLAGRLQDTKNPAQGRVLVSA